MTFQENRIREIVREELAEARKIDIEQYEKLLSVEEVAEVMKVSKSCVYKRSSDGTLKHSKPNGKRIYFAMKDVVGYMRRNPVKTQEELERE